MIGTSDSGPVKRTLPSHIQQTLVVARYELLKHLRSKRLMGAIIIVVLIVALIYSLPILLGSPYAGHMDETLVIEPVPQNLVLLYGPNATIGNLSRGGIQMDTLHVSVNGTQISDSAWVYSPILHGLVFPHDYSSDIVVASYDFKRSTNGFTDSFLSFGSILVIICAIFFGADSIVSEYQNRTAYLLFPNPVRREVLFTGKMIASIGASALVIMLFYLLISILSFASLGEIAKYLYLSFLFATLYLLGCLGVSYFISSIMKGSTGALILTLFLLLMILPIFSGMVGGIGGIKMWFLLDFAGNTISTSLSFDNYPIDSTTAIQGFTFYNYHPDLGTSAMVMFAYLVIFSIISLILFKRKQLLN